MTTPKEGNIGVDNQRIETTMVEEDRSPCGILEQAIMSWGLKEQRRILQTMKCPIYGSKPVLTARIMGQLTIGRAVEITRKHRLLMKLTKEGKTEEEVKEIEKETIIEMTDVEMSNMELALKRKREETVKNAKDKPIANEETTTMPPPMDVAGSTADRDTSITAAHQEGNEVVEVEKEDEEPGKVPEEIQIASPDSKDGEKKEKTCWVTPQAAEKNKDRDDATQVCDNVPELTTKRYGLRLTTAPSKDEPDNLLVIAAKEWFKKMVDYDSTFRVLPWKDSNKTLPTLRKIEDIPTSIGKFRTYFHRAQVRTQGGQTNIDVKITYAMDMKEIWDGIDWFFKQKGIRMFHKSIQAESIDQMGWLLYSTGNIDQLELKEAIKSFVGVSVGLRYKYINSAKYEPEQDERKKWMAIHIEVDEKDASRAERGLKKIYGSSSQAYPLGIRMRLISEYRKVKGNPTNSAKHTRLRIRQAGWLQMTKGCPGDDIAQLDFPVSTLDNKSLRDMIMAIQSTNTETPGHLYHSVGLDWKGRYVFSFLKSKEDEAIGIADGIIPYILHHYGPDTSSFFDPEALLDKEEWTWDPDSKSIINPLSAELEALEKLDSDYNFAMSNGSEITECPITIIAGGIPTAQELAIAKMNVLVNDQDAETVSTMGGSPKSVTRNLIRMTPAHNTTASVMSSSSYDTRLTQVESQIK